MDCHERQQNVDHNAQNQSEAATTVSLTHRIAKPSLNTHQKSLLCPTVQHVLARNGKKAPSDMHLQLEKTANSRSSYT